MSARNNAAYDWQYIIGIAREHRRELLIANGLALLASLCAVPIPLLMPLMVDEVLLQRPGFWVASINRLLPAAWHGPVTYVGAMLLLTAFFRLASVLLNVWQTRYFTIVAKDLTYRMRRELLRRLAGVSMAEYETMGSGTVTAHLVTDIETIDNFTGETIAKFIVAVLMLVGTAAVLLYMNWILGLFILLMNPLVIFFTVSLGKRVKHLKQRENKAFEIFQAALTETLEAIQQIRASNREKHYFHHVSDLARGIRDHATAYAWKSDAANRLSFLVFLVGFEVFRAVSMLMVVFSDLTIGQMMAVFGYLWFMMAPVQEVIGIQYSYHAAKAALQRINELLTLHHEPDYAHRSNPFKGQPTVAVEARELVFRYGDGNPVLDGVNLRIRAGEKVALVGASGGGKSTFVQVLLGLYSQESGELLFDGTPVADIGLDVVREYVAVVLQYPVLFNDSVRNNLTLGRQASDEELWQALETAQLRSEIESMDAGLDSVLGHHGVRLSGGQRQRLAIARMVLTRPSVVILDEATSALDTETENRVHAGLRRFLEGRTTIIVAHRLSAVRQADRAYVFDAGRIIEEGAHEELIGSGGLYSSLYSPVVR